MLQCTVPGCIWFFKRPEDRRRHLTKLHANDSRLTSTATATDAVPNLTVRSPNLLFENFPEDPFEDNDAHHSPTPPITPPPTTSHENHNQAPPQPRIIKTYHPHLTGEKCDFQGAPIPSDSPPDPREIPENPWEPFDDMVGFHTADLLYRKVEMSQGDTDFLLNLWSLSLAKHGDVGPFYNHEAIHEAIDSIKQGSAPWCCFVTAPKDNLPDDVPEWKRTQYEVWYRDPEMVIKNMLDNPEFADEFDTRPYIERTLDGKHRWSDIMSGNYAWTESTEIYKADDSIITRNDDMFQQ
ncbi:hypothetical protein VKT23_014308 [Stygiomarasmius scandens]|uniref:C2H2-type domain-containing protein n=1 Tax=Marasmiellus scandens TaxID=2682957 RepID=A0ABR1J3N5_9AGAR